MQELKIRNARLEDIDQIMNVEKNGFLETIQEEAEVFKQRIQICENLFYVFEAKDGIIVGYLSAEYMDGIPNSPEELKLGHTPSSITGNYIYISSFSILPEFRGNGLGKKIWNECVDKLKSEKPLLLLVNQEWEAAKHIYEKSGFVTITTFENFFPSEKKSFSNGFLMIKK